MIWVSDLPQAEQKRILSKIKAGLFAEGHTAEEIEQALEDAQDSKLADVLDQLK